MSFNLRNRSPLDPIDFAPRDIRYLLDLAAGLKRTKAAAREPPAHDQGGMAGYARSLGD